MVQILATMSVEGGGAPPQVSLSFESASQTFSFGSSDRGLGIRLPEGDYKMQASLPPGYSVKAEFNDRSHERGVLSMARSNDPDSAGSQFFICLARTTHLDHQYTAFGKLVKGDDVLTDRQCRGVERLERAGFQHFRAGSDVD